MEKILKILVSIVGLCFTALPGWGQPAWGEINNAAFISARPGVTKDSYGCLFNSDMSLQQYYDSIAGVGSAGQLRLSMRSFTFFKDNEYFNEIVEGYTLFGTQLNPQLVYYPTKDLRLEGGVFLWKDFGNSQLQQVRPTFRAIWTVNRKHKFVFGNILPALSHGYIEPLFNFERVILKPLEEGLQYRLSTSHVALDVWVDWLRQEYPGSNYQEQIAGGLNSSFRLVDKDRFSLSIPFQFTARHFGGQIDTLHAPVQTLFNYATGLAARKTFNSRTVQALRLDLYGLLYDDHSFANYRLPYQRGNGLYLNGTLETRYLDVMLSYWQGNTFYAPLGGPYYQSVASRYGTPGYTDAHRQLLYLRLLRDFRISDAAAMTVRVEPVYDFGHGILDFSAGVYLNFRQEWLLGNVGRRVRVGQ